MAIAEFTPEQYLKQASESLTNYLSKQKEFSITDGDELILIPPEVEATIIMFHNTQNHKISFGPGKKHYYTLSTFIMRIEGSHLLKQKVAILSFNNNRIIKVIYGVFGA